MTWCNSCDDDRMIERINSGSSSALIGKKSFVNAIETCPSCGHLMQYEEQVILPFSFLLKNVIFFLNIFSINLLHGGDTYRDSCHFSSLIRSYIRIFVESYDDIFFFLKLNKLKEELFDEKEEL